MKLEIYTDELTNDIGRFEESVTKPIAEGKLKGGRKYQIQVIITTNEDDFIDGEELINIKD